MPGVAPRPPRSAAPPGPGRLPGWLAARGARGALAAILVVYTTLAVGYAVGTPRWNNPDEPAHYNYVAHLARTGQLPVLQPGDWDSQALGERLTSGRFTTNEPIDRFRYEGHQPPLYYALLAPLHLASDQLGANARIVLLRGVSIALGLGLIVIVFGAGRVLAPGRPALAPLAAGLVAFIPMHTAMMAAINNDALAELLASATLLVVLLGLRQGFSVRSAAVLGVLGGLLLLTKVTVYLFFPLALLALAWESSRSGEPNGRLQLRRAAGLVGLVLAVAAVLSGWWFLRNLGVYGWPDVFGLIRHDQVVVGQPRWSGLGEYAESVRYFLYSTFRSFWAQFGWMAVVVDPRQERPYWLYLLLVLLAGSGVVRFVRTELPALPRSTVAGWGVLALALALVVAQLLVYNVSLIQAQGRYLFPAILPIALLLAVGWSAIAEITPGASRWRWLGFGLGFYVTWALSIEALSWLLSGGPGPIVLHLVPVLPLILISRVEIRQSRQALAAAAAGSLLVALALMNAAALLRFVVPYFRGF